MTEDADDLPPFTELRYQRLRPQTEDAWRHPGDRDSDRLLYSTAWRRLEGVTQVTPVGGLSLVHNRMTHSLKVAQVGRRLAERLSHGRGLASRDIEPAFVYAAGMAHDLGHPPFGHVAEKELQSILAPEINDAGEDVNHDSLADSFEGNAQSFRIVTKLLVRRQPTARKGQSPEGLNLTRGSLAALTKYPWLRGEAAKRMGTIAAADEKYFSQKWGAYNSEINELDAALGVVPDGNPRSINAEIMDFADDITYAIHDVEDYFRAGLIPLHELGAGLQGDNREYRQFMSYANGSLNLRGNLRYSEFEVTQWLKDRILAFPKRSYGDTSEDRAGLHNFASLMVDEIEKDVQVDHRGRLYVDETVEGVLGLLKELTWYYVINAPGLSASQEGQRRIVSNLHQWLVQWALECYPDASVDPHAEGKAARNRRRLPARLVTLLGICLADPALEGLTDRRRVSRAVVDYISGLTDAQAADLHAHLGGTAVPIQRVGWLQGG